MADTDVLLEPIRLLSGSFHKPGISVVSVGDTVRGVIDDSLHIARLPLCQTEVAEPMNVRSAHLTNETLIRIQPSPHSVG